MGLVSCVRYLSAYMRQTSTVVALAAGAMDSALAGDVDAPLFGPYTVSDGECEQVKTGYAVYVPPPLVGHLLGRELTARQAWDRVRGEIIDLGIEVECKPLVDWLRVSLIRRADGGRPVISVADVIAPVADKLLMLHRHALMVRHLLGLDPSIERATGAQIARKIGEVSVEMRADREERKESRNRKTEQKGAKEFFGTNLPQLLRLTQVQEVVRLNAVWDELTTPSKSKQLLVLQRALNKAAADLSLRAPTVPTPALLKMVLGLDFCLASKDNLSSGLHAFTLGKHTAARRKLLKTRANRHNLMPGGHAAPSLVDAKELVAPRWNDDPDVARTSPWSAQQAAHSRSRPLWRESHVLKTVEDVRA